MGLFLHCIQAMLKKIAFSDVKSWVPRQQLPLWQVRLMGSYRFQGSRSSSILFRSELIHASNCELQTITLLSLGFPGVHLLEVVLLSPYRALLLSAVRRLVELYHCNCWQHQRKIWNSITFVPPSLKSVTLHYLLEEQRLTRAYYATKTWKHTCHQVFIYKQLHMYVSVM